MKPVKTNAMRLLERQGIGYTLHSYDVSDGALDGVSVAHKTGVDPARVFKTLLCQGHSGGVYVFCVPVADELDLKRAAAVAEEKNMAMLPLDKLLPTTGYQKGGCSPVAMKKLFPTFIHQSAFDHDTICVSGGKVGLQIELSPIMLKACIKAVQFAE